jgi:hypothetical protein
MSSESVLKAAWDRYTANLEAMRKLLEDSPQFAAVPSQRAKMYHVMMEMQAMAYNFAVAPRLSAPRIYRNTAWQTELYTLGGNGPDFHYGTVFLDGAATYRLSGRINDSRLLVAQLNSRLPGSPGAQMLRNFDFADFALEADGSFAVTLSATEHAGNWIKLDPDSGYQWMLFRPTVETWDAEPASLDIERISPAPPDRYTNDEFDPEYMARRIDAATDFITYMTQEWTIGFYPRVLQNSGGYNQFQILGARISGEVGSPTAEYIMADFQAGPDDALLIELPDVPGGTYWSFQLFDVWLRSLSFRTRQSALCGPQIAVDADGKVRLVISQRDPGIANWLDSSDYEIGQVLLRNYRTTRSTMPSLRRLKLSELEANLPASTRRVTRAERSQELARRRAAYLRRHGE